MILYTTLLNCERKVKCIQNYGSAELATNTESYTTKATFANEKYYD